MDHSQSSSTAPLAEPLTRREREILTLLAQGLSGPEIAEKLTLAKSSVKWHIQQLYGKLGVNSRQNALARATELSLIGPASTPTAPAAPKHNLPLQVTRFFGRQTEIEQLQARLSEQRLVTLTGPGGVGKTRLSLRVAEEVLNHFADGVWFVELAPLADPALVPQQVASSVGVRDEPGRPIQDTLVSHLRERQALLVLDNCEHVLEASARLADALLRACPRLRLLVSSREALGVGGEAAFPVSSLPYPDPNRLPPAEVMAGNEAVRLFVDRARLVQPNYELAPSNAPAIASICQRLDGIPLAIEMAAARTNIFTAQQLDDRLDDAFQLLTGGSRTALPRQQTLRQTMDWSYKLLNDREKLLLQRLSVFAGGCTFEAVEGVCAGQGLEPGQLLDGLAALVAKSMVIADRRAGGGARYRLLETVRQYALERLMGSGEADKVRQAHLHFFMGLVRFLNDRPRLYVKISGPPPKAQLERLKAEQDNFRAALQWAREGGDALVGLQLAAALWLFWYALGNLSEARGWLNGAMAQAMTLHAPLEQAEALLAVGIAEWLQTDYLAARAHLEEAVRLARAMGAAGQRPLASALLHLSMVERDQVGSPVARALLEESMRIARSIDERFTLALALVTLGRTLAVTGDAGLARPYLEEGGLFFHELGDQFGQALALNNLGLATYHLGEYAQAGVLYREAIALFWHIDDVIVLVRCLEELAWVTCRQGQFRRAAALFGAAEAQREITGALLPPAARTQHDTLVAEVRAHLPETETTVAWSAGATMTLERVVEFALAADASQLVGHE